MFHRNTHRIFGVWKNLDRSGRSIIVDVYASDPLPIFLTIHDQ
ncbi:8672_t:CDS:1, partial [Funneliformis caledonium]